MRRVLAAATLSCLLLPHAAPAQSPEPPPPATPGGGRVLTAARARGALRIDGRLDEDAWARARPTVEAFTQAVPSSGAPATQRTEVRVLFDRNALYVGFRLYDSRPDSIAAQLARRDAGGIYTDWAHVAVDSYHDRRTAWRFSLNPRGVQADGAIYNDTERDPLWDAVWEGAAQVDSLGWTAEFRIPLSQLRYELGSNGAAQVWGINFTREIARSGERAYWSATPPDAPGIVSRMGTLVGLDSLGDPARLELIPYARAQMTRAPGGVGGQFSDPTDGAAATGLDVRYRLPRNLTLSAIGEPGLRAGRGRPRGREPERLRGLSSPSRRPFFLEGQDVFRFGGTRTLNDDDRPTFFYTRRLGRAPQRRVSGADVRFVDAPAQTPILAAAKVSGKTPGGWSVGALGAATRRQTCTRVAEPDGQALAYRRRAGDRLTASCASDATCAGGTPSSAASPPPSSATPATGRRGRRPRRAPRHARARGGARLRARMGRTNVGGQRRLSRARASPAIRARLLRLQRAAYRLYQRPDADHLDHRLDGAHARRPLPRPRASPGPAAATGSGSSTFEETTPGFETNDIGFQQRSDRRDLVQRAPLPREPHRHARARARLPRVRALGLLHPRVQPRRRPRGEPPRAGRVRHVAELLAGERDALASPSGAADDRLTRGGPLVQTPGGWNLDGSMRTDSRRRGILAISGKVGANRAGEWRRDVGLELDARPTTAIRLRVAPGYARSLDVDQYVTSAADPLAATTSGRRYVFADLEREELSVDTRLDWTFTPRLSLELFARPFASRGRYVTFKALAQPAAFGFAPDGQGGATLVRADGRVRLDADGTGAAPEIALAEPDFALRSLRGNAVVRWEFRPGSTVFVCRRQQQREGAFDDP